MDELFKKFLYTGVGLVSLTAEKLQESVDELIGEGKLSKEEGTKIVNDFFDNAQAKREEFESTLKKTADNVFDTIKVPTKKDYEDLMERVASLEKKLEEFLSPKKTSTSKRSTKPKSEGDKKS